MQADASTKMALAQCKYHHAHSINKPRDWCSIHIDFYEEQNFGFVLKNLLWT
jgi:hypothetical protein